MIEDKTVSAVKERQGRKLKIGVVKEEIKYVEPPKRTTCTFVLFISGNIVNTIFDFQMTMKKILGLISCFQ